MTIPQNFNSWVKCFKPNSQAQIRLFCFPYAGGNANNFRIWSEILPSTVEVCAIELPGRGSQIKLPSFTRLKPLIRAIAPMLLPYLDKPFAFFGHSMGGLVCFELTRLLRREFGIYPIHIFVSASRAPQIPHPNPPIHTLPEPEFLVELRRLNGTPVAVIENKELMQLLLPILRADFAVLETYTYTYLMPLDCPITVFGGLQDSKVSLEDIEGWKDLTCASFSLDMFKGDHFFIHSAQTLLLQTIVKHLPLS